MFCILFLWPYSLARLLSCYIAMLPDSAFILFTMHTDDSASLFSCSHHKILMLYSRLLYFSFSLLDCKSYRIIYVLGLSVLCQAYPCPLVYTETYQVRHAASEYLQCYNMKDEIYNILNYVRSEWIQG